MIPQAAITQWRNTSPWKSMHQVEQDLLLSRALVAIFSDEVLSRSLAFRGGTALHKLYLSPQVRYSEDLDFVQVRPEPIGTTFDRLRDTLAFLGEPWTKSKMDNNVMLFDFETTFPPVVKLRIKVEINCKEHFSVLDRVSMPYSLNNLWFTGDCEILTFQLEELLGSKMRALYQRKKGRDLFDLSYTQKNTSLDIPEVMECYRRYIVFPDNRQPSKREFEANLKAKVSERPFKDDVFPMLRAEIDYDIDDAYHTVVDAFVSHM